MAVRFVIGRAGTGKTHHCLHAIAEQLSDAPIVGPRLILLVPEQASLQSERALLDILPAPAVHRADVLSFQRLAYRILNDVGLPDRQSLSNTGRSMLIRLAMLRHRDQLRYYKRAERFGGFIERIGRTIAECLAETVTPDQLRVDMSSEDDPTRQARLHDVALIYESYLSLIESNRIDPTQQLEIAVEHAEQCQWLNGAQIWVDGFAGFTGQERRMLVTLGRFATAMDVTMLIDPCDNAEPSTGGWDIFQRTRRTIGQLSEVFKTAGVPIEKPIEMPSDAHRFTASSSLRRLENKLYAGETDTNSPDNSVQLIETSDPRTEVEYAVAQIVDAVQKKTDPLRYRDIAIIVRELTPYRALLTASLTSRNIPFFIDQRRPISKHPLLDLTRCLFDLAIDDYPVEPIRQLLKTGFCPVTTRQADALDNYLLATALNGAEKWNQPDWPVPPRHQSNDNEKRNRNPYQMELVQSARDTIKPLLANWYELTNAVENLNGQQWANTLRQIAETFRCLDTITEWSQHADAAGELDLADLHRQTWTSFEELCDEFETTLAGETFDVTTARLVFETAVQQWSVGLAPSMLDQVLIGSIKRSRNPDIKLAIVLGFNDNTFPAAIKEDTILNHDDRESLRDSGIDLGTPKQQHLNDEALLAYIAMTRASQQLILSYSRTDAQGNEQRPSMFLDSVRRILPKLEINKIDDPITSMADWAIQTTTDLAAQLTYVFKHESESADNDRRELFNDLYELSRQDDEKSKPISHALSSLVYDNAASLKTESIGQLYQPPYTASVSSLEAFAACPFKHFANNTLRLQERELASLQVVDLGTFHHAILEQFITSLVTDNASFADLNTTDIVQRLDTSLDHVRSNIPLYVELANPRDTFLSDRAVRELNSIVAAQQSVNRAGDMRPNKTELAFGFPGKKGLPALEITTPKGRKLYLRGFIDRVDLAETADAYLATVIDYKRSQQRTLDLADAYHGTSLQLLAYLLVLQQQGQSLFGRRIIPVAAFYQPIRERYQRVDHPSEADTTRLTKSQVHPRGFINTDHFDRIEKTDETKWSPLFAIYRNKYGGFGNLDKTDIANSGQFNALLDRIKHNICHWADQWLDGVIDVKPYRLKKFSPCTNCEFKPVCRYEPGFTPTRRLANLSRTEVLNKITSSENQSDD